MEIKRDEYLKKFKIEPEIRSLQSGNWFWIEKSALKYLREIGATGFAVYSVLASCADKHQKCFPSQKYIADKLGCSRSTVNRTIKVLAEKRLIKVIKRNRYSCEYRLFKVYR